MGSPLRVSQAARQRRMWRGLLAVGGCALTACALHSTAPSPGSTYVAPVLAATDPADVERSCRGCHARIAAQWRDSMHRRAFDNPAFSHQFKKEPLPFCRDCHAPLARGRGDEPELLRLGIGCTSCHRPLAPKANEEHHPRLQTSGCESCHQFTFPDGSQQWMQRTADEHRASPYAERSCASCHMDEGR
ncbi:MAG: multiheme c-type cytochrome, partial [Myxococcota bacterium]